MRAAVPASIAVTALSNPGGFAGGAVVVVGATGGRVRFVVGGEAVARVVGAAGAVVVVVAVGGATVVSDATPRAADGGGVREADSSA